MKITLEIEVPLSAGDQLAQYDHYDNVPKSLVDGNPAKALIDMIQYDFDQGMLYDIVDNALNVKVTKVE